MYGQAHGSQPFVTMATKEPLSSKKYIDGIYIPAGLLVVGVAIVKKEWLPYAVLVTLALSAIKFWRSREFSSAFFSPAGIHLRGVEQTS